MNLPPRRFGIGAPIRRVEDKALVTGRGRYTDDLAPDGVLRAVVIRSQMGHARFRLGSLGAARALPGVHLVWTLADLGPVGDLPGSAPRHLDGTRPDPPPRPPLAREVVKHVGDPIAFVVADDLDTARAAADLIEVDYDPLPALPDIEAALVEGAPLVWPERGSNIAFEHHLGSRQETDAAFARADRVVRLQVVNNRLVPNYLEPRGIIAQYDAAADRYTLTLGTQGGHAVRDALAEILGVGPDRIRVITPDVGGGFGPKAFVFPEYPVAALAARALGRPVKWTCERTELFLADCHGRDNLTVGEMALDAEGRFLGLRVDLVANIGAYFSEFGPNVAAGGAVMSTGVYDIAACFVRVRGVFTNTVPTEAYRGAGRPEAAYLIERLVDLCGRETGLGPVEIRRRNFVRPERLPYRTPLGRIYDSGDFPGILDAALAAADAAGFEMRAEAAERRGRLRGFGFASYIEACAFPGSEPATVRVNTDGSATLFVGTQSTGQGHATAYAQFIAGHLGLGCDRITVVQGDTDQVKQGTGTGGSRSIPIGAVSVDRAAAALATKLKAAAARALDVPPAAIVLADGFARVAASNRALSLADIAGLADAAGLVAVEDYRQPVTTFPNGVHVCEVEIDPETGETAVVGYTVVDDFGVTVNPILLAGQVHGGIAQGLGQAILERTVYDADAQLLTASFLDYALPRAAEMPFIRFGTRHIPCKTNPLGIKGAGEAGTVGACGAVMNAVIDALARAYGIRHLDMPATPARVWQAIRDARA